MESKLGALGQTSNRIHSLADKKNKHQQREKHDDKHDDKKEENLYPKEEFLKKLELINSHSDYQEKGFSFELQEEGSSFIIQVKQDGKLIQELIPPQVLDIVKLIQKKNDSGGPIKGSLLNVAC